MTKKNKKAKVALKEIMEDKRGKVTSVVKDVEMIDSTSLHEITLCKKASSRVVNQEWDINAIEELDNSKREYNQFNTEILLNQVTQILTKANSDDLDSLVRDDLYKVLLSWRIAKELDIAILEKKTRVSLRSEIEDVRKIVREADRLNKIKEEMTLEEEKIKFARSIKIAKESKPEDM